MNNNINQFLSEQHDIYDNTLNEEKINTLSLLLLNQRDTEIYDYNYNNSFTDYQDFESNYFLDNYIPMKRKRGRIKKNEIILDENNRRHSSRERDNLLKKIKTHFHKFIKNFINSILATQNINIKFTRFVQSFQNDITIKTNRMLLDLKMSQILIKIPSCKQQKDKNKIAYLKIKDNEKIKFLFSMTYAEYYYLFLESKEAKELIENEKNNDIKKVMYTFINYYRSKKPKIQEKYKNKSSKVFQLLFEY